MSVDIRVLSEAESRPALNLFRQSLNRPSPPDAEWEYLRRSYEPGRTHGAFAGDRLVGTALVWPSTLVVPGGRVLPLAAVTRVGVRADFRRRGVLTELMRAQLADVAARGEVFAGLHASEPVIYGRFGYGVASLAATVTVRSRAAVVRPEAPVGGEVRLVDGDEALTLLPRLYERTRARVGMLARSRPWWPVFYDRPFGIGEHLLVAVHSGAGGDDGFLAYRPSRGDEPDAAATLGVEDFHAANPEAVNALWRFIVGVDLVDRVKVWARPVDEPVEALFVDPRAVLGQDVRPDLWLRLVDVPTALAARSYGPGSVVVEVVDSFLPVNSGRYRVGADGVQRTGAAAELSVDVDVLAMLYLGAWRPSALAGIGLVRALDPAAVARADTVFAVGGAAWCGTFF
ncbi:GNAT family N-acetyltransferase [Actinokineospora iranica]|uniref:Predicted acetyltransferase n=1 Tax=Actinokineospora iranica TaxID=1271860 RepID=A0A1G6IW73_9PSEU|nr:GNAT family N-acetyltransferase [Actinokineospora iranica]SDC10295.1 Predicted acetyltransferase [Actinokineospora iranica]